MQRYEPDTFVFDPFKEGSAQSTLPHGVQIAISLSSRASVTARDVHFIINYSVSLLPS
jgi:hypothetical protein